MWVLLGEMFPNQMRGAALAVSGATELGDELRRHRYLPTVVECNRSRRRVRALRPWPPSSPSPSCGPSYVRHGARRSSKCQKTDELVSDWFQYEGVI